MCMKKEKKSIWRAVLLSVCISLALAALFPLTGRQTQQGQSQRAQRQLVTVWIYGDQLNASGWLRKQTAEYQRQHEGVKIWVRTVTQADLALLEEDFAHAAPDMLLFMAEEEIPQAWTQQTKPLCMAGYALVTHAKAAVTLAPTSLFGVTPAPLINAAATPVPRQDWPQRLAAEEGLGAYFLQQMQAPPGAQLMPKDRLQEAFAAREVEAALLSTRQIRALEAQGIGMELLCAAPGSDLVLYGAVMQGATAAAADVLAHLSSVQAQRALAEEGLFSGQGVRLYGAGMPIWRAVEEAVQEGWQAQAFFWPQEKTAQIHLGQMLYTAK